MVSILIEGGGVSPNTKFSNTKKLGHLNCNILYENRKKVLLEATPDMNNQISVPKHVSNSSRKSRPLAQTWDSPRGERAPVWTSLPRMGTQLVLLPPAKKKVGYQKFRELIQKKKKRTDHMEISCIRLIRDCHNARHRFLIYVSGLLVLLLSKSNFALGL